MTEYSDIPEELKERDQWLLWDSSAHSPRQPHWDGEFVEISWSDPNDWHSFEEAIEVAEKKESWGIGYVMAKDNDDYPRGLYGAIDIDEGYIDGELSDWVPSIAPFTDASTYIERSAGGDGLHIPFVGYDVPEWWKDSQINPDDPDDHRGVDVLTNKFCTFTGDTIEESGSAIAEVDPTNWLFNAYTNINGENPRLESDGDSKTVGFEGDDLNVAQVEDALDHINPDVEYTTWRNIGFALHSYFEGNSQGKQLFEQWSRQGSKWDKTAERYVEAIWESADSDGDIGPGTLFYHAQNGGWERPSRTTDGGTSVQQPPSTFEDDNEQLPITPESVRKLEQLDDDKRLTVLPARDRAYTATKIISRHPDVHIAAVEPDNEFYMCNDDMVWVPEGENELRKKLQNALRKAYQQSVLNESKEWIMGQMGPDIRREALGAPEWKLPVGNGLLDLVAVLDNGATDPIRPLQPEDRALNRLPVEYDATADCPRFEEYLQEVSRDEDIPKLQEYAGYLLYHWGQPFKKSIVLVGPTDSGKSTFTKVMREMLGHENVASETLYDLISTNWGTAQLFGKMANIRNELTSSELKRPERFKELTGGEEQINAERKREKKFQFVVTQKFLFSTNDVPKIDGADPAFYNRWLFASFPNTIPKQEQDPDLHTDIIENELSGVLNWALDGLERLLEQQQFSNERSADEKEIMWQSKSSLINRFKAEILDVTGDDSDTVAKNDVHSLLAAFADYVGKETPTQNKLTRELKKDTDIGDKEQSGTRYYTGIKIEKKSIGGRKPLDETHSQKRF